MTAPRQKLDPRGPVCPQIAVTEDLLLMGVVGSRAYGLDHDSSDTDMLGAYLAPTASFLGMTPPGRSDRSQVSHDPDVTVHELGKYMGLAAKANPTVLELLYLDDYVLTTDLGRQLVSLREHLLSAPAVCAAYLGFATSETARIARRDVTAGYDARVEKLGRHVLRLLQGGLSLYTDGHLRVRVQDRDEVLAFGREVASGNTDLLRDTLAEYKGSSPLPERPGMALLSDWLVSIRTRRLQQ